MAVKQSPATVLFFSLNSPGHINAALGIADKLKDEHGYRTVFMVLGAPMGSNVEKLGHELVVVEEAKVYEDYEIDFDKDLSDTKVDESANEHRTKKKFPGAFKWPQFLFRQRKLLSLEPPVRAFIASAKEFETTMINELLDNHDNIAKTIESIKPDLVVVDAYFIPPCVINLKIPWARLYSANPLGLPKSKLPGGVKPPFQCGTKLLTKEDRERWRKEEPEKWEQMVEGWKRDNQEVIEGLSHCGHMMAEFFAQHQCPPLEPGQMAHDSPHLNLYLFPEALDYDRDDDIFEYPPRWFRCDSLIRRSGLSVKDLKYWEEKISEGMKGKKELIFFSLGSIASGDANKMKKYIEYFQDDHQRLYVISKGVNGDKYELNEKNMIGGNYIPQTLFLERADLAIVHGGNNSITECMYYGLPMIVLPQFGDQLDNAQRVEDLGLGRRLHALNATKEDLRNAIDEVLSNKDLVERCSKIGREMRARDDPLKVTYMLKKLITDKQLDQEFINDCRKKDVSEIPI